jgi:hypothetical protein
MFKLFGCILFFWVTKQKKVAFVIQKLTIHDMCKIKKMWFHPLQCTICDVYCSM